DEPAPPRDEGDLAEGSPAPPAADRPAFHAQPQCGPLLPSAALPFRCAAAHRASRSLARAQTVLRSRPLALAASPAACEGFSRVIASPRSRSISSSPATLASGGAASRTISPFGGWAV